MSKNNIVVILDAGHGKETPGKRSPKLFGGLLLFEWEFNRNLSNRIFNKLFELDIPCIQANTDDVDIALSKRAENINKIGDAQVKEGKTPICISLHGNADGMGSSWTTANGWEVWSTTRKNNSDKLAQSFLDVFSKIFPDKRLRGHKEKNYTILEKCNYPCVLTENFFYTNKSECELMLSDEGLDKLADLHVQAILNYINKY